MTDRQNIVFIDTRVANYQTLIAGLPADSEVILINGGNGLQQMADALAGRSGVDAIHVFSHGSAGALQLGDTLLSSNTLNTYAPLLAQIGQSLTAEGDLLLYGCNVAQGEAGQAFVESIARVTQADVAASSDLTGAAALGGDWVLEVASGDITTPVAVSPLLAASYQSTLLGATITSATYNPTTNIMTLTGANLTTGAAVDVSKFTITGEGGATFTLSAKADVTASSTTTISFQPYYLDLLGQLERILNKDGTAAVSTTPYNLAAAAGWQSGELADASNAITVSGVAVPTITSTGSSNQTFYDPSAGVLYAYGSGFLIRDGANNDIVANKLSFTGEGGTTYTLTDTANVELATNSTREFTLTLSATDKAGVNNLLNKSGASSTGGTTYNLAAAEDWNAGADAAVTIADSTTPITVVSAMFDFDTAGRIVNPGGGNSADNVIYQSGTYQLQVDGANFGTSIINYVNNYSVRTSDFVAIGSADQGSVTLSLVGGQVFGAWNLHIANAGSDPTYSPFVFVEAKFGSTTVGSRNVQLGGDSVSGFGGSSYFDITGGWQGALADKLVITSSNPAGIKNLVIDQVALSNVMDPSAAANITSAAYDASTNVLTVTGANLTSGGTVDATKLTLTGEGGATYALTTTGVTASSATQIAITLNTNDQALVERMLNKDGSAAVSTTPYNLAAANGWHTGGIIDATSAVTVSNVAVPAITSTTYNTSTGVLVATGTGFVIRDGVTNDIVANKLTFTGENNVTYTLTDTANVELTSNSATNFSLTLSATDKAGVNAVLNLAGLSSTNSIAYNLAAAEDWAAGADAAVNIADSTSPITVSVPTVTSSTYNASTGALVVTGTNYLAASGATNDIIANKFTLTGEGGANYTLTDTANVEITSVSAFTLTLSATDKTAIDLLVNKAGASSTGGTTYNLAAAEDWNAGADANLIIADTTATISATIPNPTITSSTYNASTGALVVTGTNLWAASGVNNDIVANKLTLTGEGGAIYTLTDTANVDITSATAFTLTLSATDKAAANLIINKNLTLSTGGTAYNLAAAEDWNAGAFASLTIADTTATINASNVAIPVITSANYNIVTGALVVTGTGFLSASGATNDIVANKFTLKGQANGTRTLTDTANVEVTSGTSFTITLSPADKTAVDLLLNKEGLSSTGGTVYNLAAAENWAAGGLSVIDVDLTNGITASGFNALPTLTTMANITGASEDTQFQINKADLETAGNTADTDGLGDFSGFSFVVKAVSSGTLKIGADAGAATPYHATTNNTIDGTNKAFWTPAADANGTLGAFTVVAKDPAGGESVAPVQVNVVTTAVADAPVLDNTKSPALTGIAEDVGNPVNGSTTGSTLVSALVATAGIANFSDGDGNAAGLAITGINANGSLWFSTNAGTTWTQATGITAANALPLDSTALVYFAPAANYQGSLTDALTFRAWDGTSGTSGTAGFDTTTSPSASTDSDTVLLAVSAVNDAPTRTAGSLSAVTVNEDSANTTATTLGLSALTYGNGGGSDESGQTLTYTVTAIPAFVTLFKSDGTTAVTATTTVTAAELAGLKYKTVADANGTGNITWTVVDTGGGTDTLTESLAVTVSGVADTPSVTSANTTPATQTTTGLVLTRNAADSTEVTHFKITGITNGNLFQNDGTTAIANGAFITFAQGNAGLKFTPTGGGNGSFTAQASLSNVDGGLGGSTTNATIAVGAAIASATVNEDTDTGAIAITLGGSETHYKITSITGGTLFSDAGYTTQLAAGSFIASAGVTTNVYFRPAANANGTTGGNGSVVVQASTSNADAGLTGAQLTSTVTLTPVADTPSVTNASAQTGLQNPSGLVLSRNAADGAETTHFKVSGITNGNLFQNDGTTAITDGAFITFAQGNAGLKFTPTGVGNGSFSTEASTNGTTVAGSAATATITLDNAVPAFNAAGSTPADNATGVSTTADVVVVFGEALAANSDLTKIYLKDVATDTLVPATFSLNSSGQLVINPNASLAFSTAYYVTWDANALKDAAGNAMAAVNDETTFNFTTVSPPPDPTPPPTPTPTPTPDTDGVPDTVENATPGLPPAAGGTPVAGDGNGDGVVDSLQSNVTSVSFRESPTAISNPGSAPTAFVSLVADSLAGKIDSTDANSATLSNVRQLDAPANLPEGMNLPLGLISFSAAVGTGSNGAAVTETFSLYVDADLGINGYWKQNDAGTWVNLASSVHGGAMVLEGGKLRLDFALTDGGEFDADGLVNGVITDPGAAGYMPQSLVGYTPDLPDGGFWF